MIKKILLPICFILFFSPLAQANQKITDIQHLSSQELLHITDIIKKLSDKDLILLSNILSDKQQAHLFAGMGQDILRSLNKINGTEVITGIATGLESFINNVITTGVVVIGLSIVCCCYFGYCCYRQGQQSAQKEE